MHYVEPRLVIKCVAELILSEKHACGPDCLCWKLPQVPAISDAIRQLHVQSDQQAASVIAAILVQRAIERGKIGI
jgi:hypothetical protein